MVTRMVRNVLALLFSALLALPAVAQQPRRIISTLPSATETLFALGLGDRVVGVSNYCRYPPAVLSLPKVGTYIKPDTEKIALLRPDLVVIEKAPGGLPDRLSSVGLKYVEVNFGSLAEIYTMIRDIGAVAGVPDRAASLNKEIRTKLDSIRAESASAQKPRVLAIVGRTPGLLTNLIAAGSSTYLNELIQIAGGASALTDTAITYPRISLETVVRLNPDIILDMSMMGEAGEAPVHSERLRQPWLAHPELTAVRSGHVYGLTSEILVTPGPRVVDAVQEIRSCLKAEKQHKAAQ